MQGNLPSVAGQWRLVVGSSPWEGRDGAGLLELDGSLYLLGGWNPIEWSPTTVNEVWKSTDGGESWTQLPNAPWEGRHSAGWLVHDNKLWVIGGDANRGHYQTDVWSSPDGENWTLETASASWGKRVLHQVFSHAGKMWLVGGQTVDEFVPLEGDKANRPEGSYYDDVWSSEDGQNWVLVSTGNPWAPQAGIIGSAVKDGFMWLVAGGAYNTEGNPRIYKSTVWRSGDGKDWDLLSTGAFPARYYNNVVLLNDDLVLIAGYDGANCADAWASKDGIVWREFKQVPWAARHAASACCYKGEVLLLGGPLSDTTIWALS